MIELDLRCKKCTRFLNIKAVDSMIAQVRCPSTKCKHLNNVKVINTNSSMHQLKYSFTEIK